MYSLSQMQKRHERARKFIIGFIIAIVILIFAMFGIMGYIAVEAVDVIKTEGLKSVIDTIWNGTGK